MARWAAESVPERAARLVSLGVAAEVAVRLAAGYDEAMGRCILALYRSAAQLRMMQFEQGLHAAAAPGLHICATEDHFVATEEMQRRAAGRAARIEVLDGLGQWWMVQDPARGAAALTQFWASLPDWLTASLCWLAESRAAARSRRAENGPGLGCRALGTAVDASVRWSAGIGPLASDHRQHPRNHLRRQRSVHASIRV